MNYKVLTLFPEMIESVMNTGIIGRALKEEKISLKTYNIRDYADNNRAQIDDYPYGGGAGQVIMAEPVLRCFNAAEVSGDARVIYLSPQGRRFDQRLAKELSREDELVFLCGHYEGIDERVLETIVTDYISAGDYILTGGELPSLMIMDAVSRLLPGVLGNDSSPDVETFFRDLLEYPQYSRPEIWNEKKVPPVLLGGNHSDIENYRLSESIVRTRLNRPDLYEKYVMKASLSEKMKKARLQNIPSLEALLFDDCDIIFESDSLYLIADYDELKVYAGCFDKKSASFNESEFGKIRGFIDEFSDRSFEVYLFNLHGIISDEKTENLTMLTFTEKNPLSSARVKEYGEEGLKLRERITLAHDLGRTYYEFVPATNTEYIENALKIGLYSSAVELVIVNN